MPTWRSLLETMHNLNAIVTIAFRDIIKLLRDRSRILASFIFPVIFIGFLGSSLQQNIGASLSYNYMTFVFIGVLGQTLFQSTASGIISLVEDRQTDFAQEMFIAPISRYSILMGKIMGETMVALIQIFGVLLFAFVIRIPVDWASVATALPFFIPAAFFGGAFGVLVMSSLSEQRSANQIFPFLIFPQFFLAGVFTPVKYLPPVLLILSRLSPMTYAVDLIRSIYYWGTPEYSEVVLFNPLFNLAVVLIAGIIFMTIGTHLFVRNERNR